MEALVLQAAVRKESGTMKSMEVRAAAQIPAVVYGKKQASMNVSVDGKIFNKMLLTAGESTIIDLQVEGAKAPMKTLVQEIQRDPISDSIIHIDFRAISMDEKLRVKVPFRFIGESAAVKGQGGTLVKNLEEVEVLCLPSALVSHIDVDISVLKTFEDKIRLHSVKLPEGMEAAAKTDEVVVLVAPPRTDEEMAKLEGAVDLDASKVESSKKEKKVGDEEVAADGAAPAAGAAAAKPGDKAPAAEKKPAAKK